MYRACDAALTAELGASFFPATQPTGIEAGPRRYRTAQRVLNLAAVALPAAYRWWRARLMQPVHLPLAERSVVLLAFGSDVTVFLVWKDASDRADDDATVLKVYRRSLGMRPEALLEEARIRRRLYERVAAWYAGGGLMLPTHFLVCHGPLLARRAVACVQPFVSGPQKDVFTEVPQTHLVELLRAHVPLRRQFLLFAEQTLRAAEREGACVDIVGRGNLVLLGAGDAQRLLLLDYGVYTFSKQTIAPAARAEMSRRLDFLRRVHAQMSQ